MATSIGCQGEYERTHVWGQGHGCMSGDGVMRLGKRERDADGFIRCVDTCWPQ
jgi:hypothetical protein